MSSILKQYFENPTMLLMLKFLSIQSELFYIVIKIIKENKISVIDVKTHIDSLKEKRIGRRDGDFIITKEMKLLDNLRNEGLITEKKYQTQRPTFFSTCIDYIDELSSPSLKIFDGIS